MKWKRRTNTRSTFRMMNNGTMSRKRNWIISFSLSLSCQWSLDSSRLIKSRKPKANTTILNPRKLKQSDRMWTFTVVLCIFLLVTRATFGAIPLSVNSIDATLSNSLSTYIYDQGEEKEIRTIGRQGRCLKDVKGGFPIFHTYTFQFDYLYLFYLNFSIVFPLWDMSHKIIESGKFWSVRLTGNHELEAYMLHALYYLPPSFAHFLLSLKISSVYVCICNNIINKFESETECWTIKKVYKSRNHK